MVLQCDWFLFLVHGYSGCPVNKEAILSLGRLNPFSDISKNLTTVNAFFSNSKHFEHMSCYLSVTI